MWQRLLRWGWIRTTDSSQNWSQLSPPELTPSKHTEEIPNCTVSCIFFIRNGNHKEILSKIFISAKKERPGKGWQRAKLTVDYWPEPRTHFWVQLQKAQNRGWSTATT